MMRYHKFDIFFDIITNLTLDNTPTCPHYGVRLGLSCHFKTIKSGKVYFFKKKYGQRKTHLSFWCLACAFFFLGEEDVETCM